MLLCCLLLLYVFSLHTHIRARQASGKWPQNHHTLGSLGHGLGEELHRLVRVLEMHQTAAKPGTSLCRKLVADSGIALRHKSSCSDRV